MRAGLYEHWRCMGWYPSPWVEAIRRAFFRLNDEIGTAEGAD